jgi:hypothetical protein
MFVVWRFATALGHAIMHPSLFIIFGLFVTLRAMALVVIDQILATARITCIFHNTLRAIGDVLARPAPIDPNDLLKAAVASALVVILVHTSRCVQVDAFPVWATLVCFAVILVGASRMRRKLSTGQARHAERDRPNHLAICGVSWIATECSVITKCELCGTLSQLSVCRECQGALNWSTSIVGGIETVGLACYFEGHGASYLRIHRVTFRAGVLRFFLEHVGQTRMTGLHFLRCCTAAHRQATWGRLECGVCLAGNPESAVSRWGTIHCVPFNTSVLDGLRGKVDHRAYFRLRVLHAWRHAANVKDAIMFQA